MRVIAWILSNRRIPRSYLLCNYWNVRAEQLRYNQSLHFPMSNSYDAFWWSHSTRSSDHCNTATYLYCESTRHNFFGSIFGKLSFQEAIEIGVKLNELVPIHLICSLIESNIKSAVETKSELVKYQCLRITEGLRLAEGFLHLNVCRILNKGDALFLSNIKTDELFSGSGNEWCFNHRSDA